MQKHCNTTRLLRDAGLRATWQRIAILDLLLSAARPLTAADVHKQVQQDRPLDQATVYRTLRRLQDAQLVREINDPEGAQHFEGACVHQPMHPHFRCLSCERLQCLEVLSFADAAPLIRLAAGYDVQDVAITMTGRCRNCVQADTGASR
jgi:Fe2+ or Zn2+ uptake regulation protein